MKGWMEERLDGGFNGWIDGWMDGLHQLSQRSNVSVIAFMIITLILIFSSYL